MAVRFGAGDATQRPRNCAGLGTDDHHCEFVTAVLVDSAAPR
jgi:hypothetical protein